MKETEFDKFADEYREIHGRNIKLSGERPEYFAEFKVRETSKILAERSLPASRRILDFGAGTGISLPYFTKYYPGWHVTCLDVSKKSLAIGEKRFPGQADFVRFDGHVLPFPNNHFSLVFAACVFHHIAHEEHHAILAELRRVLDPAGIAIIFEHNPLNPLTRYAVNTCPFDENAKLITARTLRRRMIKAGFGSVASRYRLFFPRLLSRLRPIEPYMGWLPLGAQYYVFAEKST